MKIQFCKFFVVVCICFLPSYPVFAFKIDNHVWLSQQVLNDVLDDGRINIAPYGSFKVNDRLVNALRNYPDEFRMGSIGPDGFPDLVGGQQTVHPGVSGGWKTDDWLEHMLKSAKSDRELAFAYGYLNHAAADTFAHTYVNMYAGDMFNLLDGQEVELRHMALEEYIKDHMPPVVNNANQTLNPHEIVSAPAAFLRDTLVLNSTVANEYRKQPGTMYLALMYDEWKAIGQIISQIENIKADASSVVDSIQVDIDSIQDEIDSLKDIKVSVGPYKVNLYPAYCVIDPGTCLVIQSLIWSLEAAEQSLEVPQYINGLAISALEKPLQAWRGEIEEAIKQYMITSQNISIELMKPNGDPLAQLQSWVCEWAPVFAGIPNEISWPACATSSAVNRIKKVHTDITNGIADFRGAVADKLGVMGWAVDPAYQVELLIDEHVKQPFKDFALEIAESLLTKATGENSLTLDILTFRTEEQTASKLNEIFSGDSSGKGLLNIYYISGRVEAEMHLDSSTGHLDPDKYNLVHNAIVLSKLVMLDASQLNLLVKRAGIAHTIYGTDLYNPETFSNILIGSIASIDGNHQWQEYAPDYPRRSDASDNGVAEENYGYAFNSMIPYKDGFRLWQDCEVRDLVFKKIFNGPIAPGLEVSSLVNFAPIEDYDNPTDVSVKNPFPLSYRSSLTLKALSDDPAFSAIDWLSTGDLTALFTTDHLVLQSTPLLPVSLPTSKYLYEQKLLNSADLLVLPLSAQACGGSIDVDSGMTAKWGFKTDCIYECVCEDYLFFNPVTRRSEVRTSCRCTNSECGDLPVMNSWQDLADYGITASSSTSGDCNLCHLPGSTALGLTAGTYYAKTKYVPGLKAVNNGVEYNGSLICDVNAIQTKLIMKPVDQIDINLIVTDIATGERAVAESLKTTNYPELVGTYSDWHDVNAAVLTSTNNEFDACGIAQIADENSFEADTQPPALTVPASVSMSCADLNDLIAQGNSVQDVIGQATVVDNRDPDVQLSNDAPISLAVGNTIIDWIAVDDAGNSISASQMVKITDIDDPEFTTVIAPLTVTATNPLGTPVTVSAPVAFDACEGSIIATTSANLGAMPIGESTISWTAQDSSGNSANISQQITVKVLDGDLNSDGKVDSDDLSLLVNAVGNVAISETTLRDFDQDGDIDANDQAIFDLVNGGENDPYDLNNDHIINELDARLLLMEMPLQSSADVDADGVGDIVDNCVVYFNPGQLDSNGNGIGDACESIPQPPSNITVEHHFDKKIHMTWSQPVKNVDGTPVDGLRPNFVLYSRIPNVSYPWHYQWSFSPGPLINDVYINMPDYGTWYLVVYAQDINGNYSSPSEEVSITLTYPCADVDGDGFGIGDISSCPGSTIYFDNCPVDSNPGQSDIDYDGVGDLCDVCPSDLYDRCNPSGSSAAEISVTDGGIVSTPDGQLTIGIDPGDLIDNATISVTNPIYINNEVDLIFGSYAGAGQAVAFYELEPDGLSFANSVTLKIVTDVTGLSTEQREKIELYRAEDTSVGGITGTYYVSLGASCNVVENPIGTFIATCTVQVDHFSNYAIVAPLDSDSDGVPDTFGGISDACPNEDATGFDADIDGCIDSFNGLLDLVGKLVNEGVISATMKNSLVSKVSNAESSLGKENVCTAINELNAFKNQVDAQTGKKISIEAATQVKDYADSVSLHLLSQLPSGETCN